MRYSTFEMLAAVFGTIAIVGTVVAGVLAGGAFTETLAQLMLLPVLLSALHFGRNGGFLAALFAVALYVGLRMGDIAELGIRSPLTILVIERAAAYIVIGVLGGELCSRIKYVFLKLERRNLIDDETDVYAPRHLGQLLKNLIESQRRYGVGFSAGILTLDGAVLPMAAHRGRRSLLGEIAASVRDDVRAVDEVGRFSDHSLMVLFPNTAKSGGEVAIARLLRTVSALLARRGLETSSVPLSVETLGYPEDAQRLIDITEELTGEPISGPAARTLSPEAASQIP